jgi:hypothetical protein
VPNIFTRHEASILIYDRQELTSTNGHEMLSMCEHGLEHPTIKYIWGSKKTIKAKT